MTSTPTTISTATGAVFAPLLVRGYRVRSAPRSIVHRTLSGGVHVVQRPAGARTGDMELLFATEVTAEACRAAHASGQLLTLTDPAAPTAAMTYTATDASLTEDDEFGWWVAIAWQEVP